MNPASNKLVWESLRWFAGLLVVILIAKCFASNNKPPESNVKLTRQLITQSQEHLAATSDVKSPWTALEHLGRATQALEDARMILGDVTLEKYKLCNVSERVEILKKKRDQIFQEAQVHCLSLVPKSNPKKTVS